MRVDLLCSGSKGNSCLVTSGDARLLIDCGSTKRYLTQALAQVDVRVEDLLAVLITHSHSDHISQLKLVKDVPLFSCCELKEGVRKHRIMPGDWFILGPFRITVIALSHDAPGGCVGYKIDDGTSTLVYVTDTGFVPNAARDVLAGADAYVFESNHDVEKLMATNRPMYLKQRILSASGHLNNADSAHCLSEIVTGKTKEVILAHLSDEANTPDLALEAFHEGFASQGLNDSGIRVQCGQQKVITSTEEF
ncbi:MBL fold metallo-hydrolase [uncultured Faecalibaculum sp.]|uniref:MBL fold metallo-hydrolase n=1 Tax=uncultured Faecalibaculum sp. TaxID=1729681 RepID=UPI0025D2E884|nr:MBL fold metallo-hydrolase [uncultured Faecalibaculum sp.]